jgi:hypothetical protein
MPLVRRLVLALALVLITGCTNGSTIQLPGTGPLVTVTMRGGECAMGPCDQTVVLDRDGRVHSAAKPPNDLGQVPANVMTTVTAAIQQTDFAALKSHPFTGECPVNFDGQELIFEFNVGSTTQRIASCEVAIDWGHPLFVALATALGEWLAMPVT